MKMRTWWAKSIEPGRPAWILVAKAYHFQFQQGTDYSLNTSHKNQAKKKMFVSTTGYKNIRLVGRNFKKQLFLLSKLTLVFMKRRQRIFIITNIDKFILQLHRRNMLFNQDITTRYWNKTFQCLISSKKCRVGPGKNWVVPGSRNKYFFLGLITILTKGL